MQELLTESQSSMHHIFLQLMCTASSIDVHMFCNCDQCKELEAGLGSSTAAASAAAVENGHQSNDESVIEQLRAQLHEQVLLYFYLC